MAVDFAPSRPLQVEIVELAPASDSSTVAVPQSDFRAPAGPAAVRADKKELERPRQDASATAVTGPELKVVPDRYYTSGELDLRAEPLNEIPLVYPQLAYQRRIKGKVLVRILISHQGRIDEVSIVEAQPQGIFEEATLSATQGLVFSPAIRRGQPVKSQKILEVTFDPYESIHLP
jgi:protein TonB